MKQFLLDEKWDVLKLLLLCIAIFIGIKKDKKKRRRLK